MCKIVRYVFNRKDVQWRLYLLCYSPVTKADGVVFFSAFSFLKYLVIFFVCMTTVNSAIGKQKVWVRFLSVQLRELKLVMHFSSCRNSSAEINYRNCNATIVGVICVCLEAVSQLNVYTNKHKNPKINFHFCQHIHHSIVHLVLFSVCNNSFYLNLLIDLICVYLLNV